MKLLDRIAFGSNAFTSGKYTLEDTLRIIAREGYSGVNLLADAPLLWPLTLSMSQLRSIGDTLRETGLTVSSINGFTAAGHLGGRKAPPGQDFGPSFSDKDPASRAQKITYTKQVIELAWQLGVHDVSIGSGYPPEGVDRDVAWQWMREAIEEAVAYAKPRGVHLNIESEPALLVGTPDDVEQLLKEVPAPALGVNADIGHWYVCGEDVSTQIRRFKDRIHGADIEDIALVDGKPRHYHLVPGDGDMPLQEIFKTFREIGFEEWYTIELYSQSHRPISAAHETMQFFRNWERTLS